MMFPSSGAELFGAEETELDVVVQHPAHLFQHTRVWGTNKTSRNGDSKVIIIFDRNTTQVSDDSVSIMHLFEEVQQLVCGLLHDDSLQIREVLCHDFKVIRQISVEMGCNGIKL